MYPGLGVSTIYICSFICRSKFFTRSPDYFSWLFTLSACKKSIAFDKLAMSVPITLMINYYFYFFVFIKKTQKTCLRKKIGIKIVNLVVEMTTADSG